MYLLTKITMLNSWIKKFSTLLATMMSRMTFNNGQNKETSLSLLHNAAQKGDLRYLKLILSKENPSVDLSDETGSTPIFYALEYNHKEVAEFLLKQKANINHLNTFGRTPLFAAIDSNNPDVINFALNNGADPNTADSNGETILHYGIINKKDNSLFFILENDNLPINTPNNFGKTPLILAAEFGLTNICNTLMSKGALIDAPDNDGWTALMYACNKNLIDLASLLIASGADINLKDKSFNQTAYLIACRSGNLEIADILIRQGANSQDVDYYERTALHIAVETNSLETVEFVLKTNVDVFARDKFNLSAKEWGIVNASVDVLRLVIQAEKK